MENWKLRKTEELTEIKQLLKEIPEEYQTQLKVVGSYLFTENWHDIDIVTPDIYVGYLIKEVGRNHKIPIQIILATPEEFDHFQEYMTFHNTAVCYDCFMDNYYSTLEFKELNMEDSNELKLNNKSIEKFKNSSIVFREIEKMKKRGFTI